MYKLTEEDYDFSKVPKSELLDCLFYEYMRESKVIRREVGKVRRRMLYSAKRLDIKNGQSFSMNVRLAKVTYRQGIVFDGMMIAILACGSNFLNVPWQKLSRSEKERLRSF